MNEREAMHDAETLQQEARIRQMFSDIAHRYDLLNRLLSLGQDGRWRRAMVAQAALPEGGRLLDLATGTGDVALLAARRFPRSTIVATDLTPRMVELAREKEGAERVRWGVADAISLPFPDRSFDVVTSAFMLRNVPDVRRAFAEQWRVLRPGGQSLTLEMCWPDRAPMSVLFHLYFLKWTPLLGGLLSGYREAYTYLPQSVRRFMRPAEVAAVMRDVGFREVSWSLRMGGTVALYTGKR